MKKLIAIATIAAFVLSATPAAAYYGGWWGNDGGDITVNTSNTGTYVRNDVVTVAKTGGNDASSGSIRTGSARATSYADNYVNGTDVGIRTSCDCDGDVTVNTGNHSTNVGNEVVTIAKTGGNDVSGGHFFFFGGGGGSIVTGSADAFTSAVNVVNSTMVRVRR